MLRQNMSSPDVSELATQLTFAGEWEREARPRSHAPPFKTQLLKWIGNKQRFAHEIIQYFPPTFGTYFEPFLGSGAVLGTLVPQRAVASDALEPLVEIW